MYFSFFFDIAVDRMAVDTDSIKFSSLERVVQLNNSLQKEKEKLEMIIGNVDKFFLIVIGLIILFMQSGFAFLEAGSVRYLILFRGFHCGEKMRLLIAWSCLK